jgi:competence transcription factor ComK
MPPKKYYSQSEYIPKQSYQVKEPVPYEHDDDDEFEDLFDPISKPIDDHMRVPCDIETHTVKSANDIPLLNKVVGEPFVGFNFKSDSKGFPTLIILAGIKHAYLIDLEQLKDTKQLDQALTKVFKNKKTVIVHLSLNAALMKSLEKSFPDMQFWR